MKRIIIVSMAILIAVISSGFALCVTRELSLYRIEHNIFNRENRFSVLEKHNFCEYKMKIAVYRNELLTDYGY